MKVQIADREHSFDKRHIGPGPSELIQMLERIGVNSVDELIGETIPDSIRKNRSLNLPSALGEHEFLTQFKTMMSENIVAKNYIGMGYYDTLTPTVILRNILENPGWYTAYTPYQAEIAQGRLEALINFQTTVVELTGMEIANASLLDEGTAAAEAMSMFYGKRPKHRKKAEKFFVDSNTYPQTLDILKTRAHAVDIKLIIDDLSKLDLTDEELYGCYIQYPNNDGAVIDHTALIGTANDLGIQVVVGADLLSLCLLKSPGAMGADAVVGTTQRFGIPYGFGGPHAAYFATRELYKSKHRKN